MDFKRISSGLQTAIECIDLESAIASISELAPLLKKDEDSVAQTARELDGPSADHYVEAINYLDGALFFSDALTRSKGDLSHLCELLSLGWTSDTYAAYEDHRAKPFKNPVVSETTDYFTVLKNEQADAGFETLEAFILEEFGGLEAFALSSLQDYYFENILENVQFLEV